MKDINTSVKFKNIDGRYKPCNIDSKTYSIELVNIPDDYTLNDIQYLLDDYVKYHGVFRWTIESVDFNIFFRK